MRGRAVAAAVTLAATLGLVACSGAPGADEPGTPAASPPSSPPASPPSSAPSSAAGAPAVTPAPGPDLPASDSPSPLATLGAERCLSGRYDLVRFVAVGGSTYGTGQGGDLTVAFDEGRYTLTGAGREPMVVTLGGQTGNLTVDGESKGTYTRQDAVATFTPGSSTGGGTLADRSGTKSRKLTMEQVDNVVGLAGEGQVACTAQAMTITLSAMRLELARV